MTNLVKELKGMNYVQFIGAIWLTTVVSNCIESQLLALFHGHAPQGPAPAKKPGAKVHQLRKGSKKAS